MDTNSPEWVDDLFFAILLGGIGLGLLIGAIRLHLNKPKNRKN